MSLVEKLLRDRPAFHLGGTAHWDSSVGTLHNLEQRLTGKEKSLEVGCGVSTVIFAAAGCDHTVLSADPREHDGVKLYCDRAGIDHSKVTFVTGFSDDALPGMFSSRVLDAAYIDGAHHFPYPLVDWHYVSRFLKVGGWLLVDDVPIPPVTVAYRFMRSDPAWRFESMYDNRSAVFTLIAEPGQDDWTKQAFSRTMDYSFAPVTQRTLWQLRDEIRHLRRAIGERHPSLRRLWRSLQAPATKA